MREEILRILRERKEYVSGQELCETLGVSRTAVWKCIRRLEEEGYEIEAVPRSGYRLLGSPDSIAEEEVASRLTTERMGHPIRYFAQIDSTNRLAGREAAEGAPEGLLVIADEQTAGRGRRGRTWSTPAGSAVAFSLVLRPALAPESISMVTLVMGLAVAQAVEELYGLAAGIKWPNDVVINGRKLSGTLTEMSAEAEAVHYLVVGTGINANMTAFPEELRQTATSLTLELGRSVNRAELIAAVMRHFEADYDRFTAQGDLASLLPEYNRLLVSRGKEVRVLEPGHEYSGTSHGIDERGRLLVEKADGEVTRVYAGEVSVRGIYGYV